jgi:drug/metabolite transporter (DMT)-like permease
MNKQIPLRDWLILLLLAVIWGTSFILIKRGVGGLAWHQVGALRVTVACLSLSPLLMTHFRRIPRASLKYVMWVGILGSGIPPFLFALGQLHIPSGIAGVLNSTTTLFVLVIGLLFFAVPFVWFKLLGVLLGMAGVVLLLMNEIQPSDTTSLEYGLIIIVATMMYGTSVNVLKTYLQNVHPLAIASAAMIVPAVPSLILLITSGFFHTIATDSAALEAAGFICILGVMGTAAANVLFFGLAQRTNALFASTVTYLIPIVAIAWGYLDTEPLKATHIIGMLLILAGVYLASLRRNASG